MAQFGAEWGGLGGEQEAGETMKANLPSRLAGWFFWLLPRDWKPDTHTYKRSKDTGF